MYLLFSATYFKYLSFWDLFKLEWMYICINEWMNDRMNVWMNRIGNLIWLFEQILDKINLFGIHLFLWFRWISQISTYISSPIVYREFFLSCVHMRERTSRRVMPCNYVHSTYICMFICLMDKRYILICIYDTLRYAETIPIYI